MGYGDDLMLTAEVARLAEANGLKKVVVGKHEWSPIWENNPHVAPPDYRGPTVKATNYIGKRPYIKGCDGARIIYNEDHRPESGELYLSTSERINGDLHKDLIIVEPHVKGTFSGNKAWKWDRWIEVSNALGATQLLQDGKKIMPGGRGIKTKTIRHAIGVLSRAKLLITTDGALHHAAAALGVPCVVLWGARTHPKILGYPEHENIYTGQGESCGMMVPCQHCVDAMDRITTEMVIDAARRLLD